MDFADQPNVDAGNLEQQRFWNEEGATAWTDLQDRMDLQLAAFGDAVLAAGAPSTGQRVLDVGCGCGATLLSAAVAVGPTGSAIGVDISAPMLALAARRAADADLLNVETHVADVQVAVFPEESFDVVLSRFGVMFFSDPAAAFANLRRATKRGGRLAFACWQSPTVNLWASGLAAALTPVLPPQPPVDPLAPGPFAFADPDPVRSILSGAGWASVEITPLTTRMLLFGGGALEDTIAASVRIGPASRVLTAPGADPSLRGRAADAIRAYLATLHTSGGILMDGAAWIVRATRPIL